MSGANTDTNSASTLWPSLPLDSWQDTYATLHMWTQVVGKIRMTLTPFINHWWNVPLYVTPRGLTTSAIPYNERIFSIDFDFHSHQLVITCSDGAMRALALQAMTVAEFYARTMALLAELGITVQINTLPSEVPDPIRFEEDIVHQSYDPESVRRFWQILVQVEKVLTAFRAEYTGKCSPVHFFWGSFDIAVTRFSGRPAPPRDGADSITRVSYNAELSSVGFWPGAGLGAPAFYAYHYPEPPGYSTAPIHPEQATYNSQLGEYLMPYEDIRTLPDPATAILEFARSTYEAGAKLQGWDSAAK